jgi:hypothetical protein
MKKLLAAFCLVCGAAVAVNAQETTDNTTDQARNEVRNQNPSDQDRDDYTDKERISATDLPAGISQQLQGQDYSGWSMGEVYRKEKDGQTFYVVEMTQGNETKMVKFDAQGNKIKEKDKDKKHKDK